MGETWLYRYNTKTKKQSMEWRHSGSLRPKIFDSNSAAKVLASIFLGSRQHTPYSFSYKGPIYERGMLLISTVSTEGHFEGKT
jgi:hypothetical protein